MVVVPADARPLKSIKKTHMDRNFIFIISRRHDSRACSTANGGINSISPIRKAVCRDPGKRSLSVTCRASIGRGSPTAVPIPVKTALIGGHSCQIAVDLSTQLYGVCSCVVIEQSQISRICVVTSGIVAGLGFDGDRLVRRAGSREIGDQGGISSLKAVSWEK